MIRFPHRLALAPALATALALTPWAALRAQSADAPFHLDVPATALDSAATAQVTAIVQRARADGLPIAPIVAKVRLGILRRAPDAEIVAASRALAERLAAARTALAPQPTGAEIAAGADALGSGVTVAALQQVRRAAPAHALAVPLGVLSQLVSSGVPVQRAAAIVTDLLQRGIPPAQLVKLGNDVNVDVSSGAAAEAALDIRLQQLNAVLGALDGASGADGSSGGGNGVSTAASLPGKKP